MAATTTIEAAHAVQLPVTTRPLMECGLARNGSSGDKTAFGPVAARSLLTTFLVWPLVDDRVHPFCSGAGVALPRMGVKMVVTVGTLSKAFVTLWQRVNAVLGKETESRVLSPSQDSETQSGLQTQLAFVISLFGEDGVWPDAWILVSELLEEVGAVGLPNIRQIENTDMDQALAFHELEDGALRIVRDRIDEQSILVNAGRVGDSLWWVQVGILGFRRARVHHDDEDVWNGRQDLVHAKCRGADDFERRTTGILCSAVIKLVKVSACSHGGSESFAMWRRDLDSVGNPRGRGLDRIPGKMNLAGGPRDLTVAEVLHDYRQALPQSDPLEAREGRNSSSGGRIPTRVEVGGKTKATSSAAYFTEVRAKWA